MIKTEENWGTLETERTLTWTKDKALIQDCPNGRECYFYNITIEAKISDCSSSFSSCCVSVFALK